MSPPEMTDPRPALVRLAGRSRLQRSRYSRLLAMLVACGVLLTLAPLAAEASWVAELFTHFRLQYVMGGSVLLLVCLGLRQFTLAAVLAICVVVNARPMLPYLPTSEAQASGPGAIRILSVNVRVSNRNPERLLDLVARTEPDLLLVLEHSQTFDAALNVLHEKYPYRLRAPGDNSFGVGFYSRLPVAHAEVFRNGASDAVRAVVASEWGSFEFIGVHLMPPSTSEWAAARNEQLARLPRRIAGDSGRAVVCGDFNISPYSPYFHRLLETTGLRDPRVGRGLNNTWPVGYLPLGIPIDHCLTGEELTVRHLEVLGDIGSDHYPLLVEIIPGTQ